MTVPKNKGSTDLLHFDAMPLSAATEPATDMVVRSGLLFRSGTYPDKQFAITPDELRAAAQRFTGPGYVELEHFATLGKASILDGKLGELRSVRVSEDGSELYGDVALPLWLDSIAGDAGRKVSCVWDRPTKTLHGVGLVLEPAIKDAALMAAFAGSRHSSRDAADIQQIHDLALQQGASCPADEGVEDSPIVTIPGRNGVGFSTPAKGGGPTVLKRPRPDDPEVVAHMDDGYRKPRQSTRGRRMKITDWLKGKALEEGVELDSVDFGSAPDPRVEVLQQELAATKAQFAATQAQSNAIAEAARLAEAIRFADGEIAALHILPAGRDALVALFAQCATADASGGTVTFANGEQHAHVDALKAVFSALPPHTLTQEQLLGADQLVLLAKSNPNPDAPMTEERRQQLLNLSPLGQAALKNGKN